MSALQIIVPVFNEQEVVDLFYEEMKQTLQSCNVSWTILFVDDDWRGELRIIVDGVVCGRGLNLQTAIRNAQRALSVVSNWTS